MAKIQSYVAEVHGENGDVILGYCFSNFWADLMYYGRSRPWINTLIFPPHGSVRFEVNPGFWVYHTDPLIINEGTLHGPYTNEAYFLFSKDPFTHKEEYENVSQLFEGVE